MKAIQQKLDRLDEAFLYSESIDLTSYSRQRDRLREELTLAKIDHHTGAVDELDVEGSFRIQGFNRSRFMVQRSDCTQNP